MTFPLWRTPLLARTAGVALGWTIAVPVATAALVVPMGCLAPPWWRLRGWCGWLRDVDAGAVVQLVPAVVVAIFVFAVGTAFVVAQIVPPARGTRATTMLQGRRMRWTVAPAPALLIGSVFAVVLDRPLAGAVSVVILAGAVAYLLGSLACMLAILGDATDPSRFKALVRRKAAHAVRRQMLGGPSAGAQTFTAGVWLPVLSDPDDIAGFRFRERRRRRAGQQATDDLYDIVRTTRGWVRVAARTNDSRELQESLECLLELIDLYATGVLTNATVDTVPSVYWRPSGEVRRNPLHSLSVPTLPGEPWAAPRLVERSRTPGEFATLPWTWFANETGRAVVRAIELGMEASSLLDRDTSRLLNTLVNAAMLFHTAVERRQEPSRPPIRLDDSTVAAVLTWNAGVMVRYLVEAGLGVRHATAEKADWYREAAARLAVLQRDRARAGTPASGTLATEAAAGVLTVAAACIDAGEEHDDESRCRWAKRRPSVRAEVVRQVVRAAGGLVLDTAQQRAKVLEISCRGMFEPGERTIVERVDRSLLESLLSDLTAPDDRSPRSCAEG